ncbi:hypothetical protein TrRE_jg12836 [Triparma retinervis]|uniref:MYND-type domain-containing protein n=1 Tax=Triparma retinervis TaxID=2557542 RepID=A0A9W7DTU9_9STRA|nr:hypothetical protein TrRE_jg12836 [Triparma retinervis]
MSFDDQGYLFLMPMILKKRPTANNIDALSESELMKLVKAPLEMLGEQGLQEHHAHHGRRVDLRICGLCLKAESAMGEYKHCPCKQVSYCGKACQKKHWKKHKANCSARPSKAAQNPKKSLPPKAMIDRDVD